MADTENQHLLGLVDMGSNGIRFSISDLSPPTARIMPTLFQDRLGVSLYDAQYDDNGQKMAIAKEVMHIVTSALQRFKIVCSEFGVPHDKVRIVATEATRTAINAAEFQKTIKDATGWNVDILTKEDEGSIGGWGVASSFCTVRGLVMDLGGGSMQLSWLHVLDGQQQQQPDSPKTVISLPYGAAAMKRRLEEADATGSQASSDLRKEVKDSISSAIASINTPTLDGDTPFTLYLTGGGFRGWGYTLMASHPIQPYPISNINGFEVSKSHFLPSAQTSRAASSSTFRISSRRATQIPAIAFLITILTEVLPSISSVYFAQGGVREGLIFSELPSAIRAQHPVVAATQPYAPRDAEKLTALLSAGIPPNDSQSIPSFTTSPCFLTPLIHLLTHHASAPKDIRAAAALRSTTTGILGPAHGLRHTDRALLALALCERWGGRHDVSPADLAFYDNLVRLVGGRKAWWARYVGILAGAVGDAYPAGVVREERMRIAARVVGEGEEAVLEVGAQARGGYAGRMTWLEEVRKLGKRKNAVEGFRVRVEVIGLS
ncbi:hypothetical protein MMC13_008092 [Lambiella insularis]|nr:hypothetical protein [Lambiella insularis]